MLTMTTRTLLTIALWTASTAHADTLLVGDPPPPPPPPPPHVVVAITPPLVAVTPEPRPPLADRWTLTPATGVLWMQVQGISGSGIVLAPTVTRTFDRYELSADYTLSRLGESSQPMPTTVVHRLGASVGYQAGRIRVGGTMTLDLVVQGGLGIQHLVRDHAEIVDRPDVSLGINLRMLDDVSDQAPRRIFFGMEIGARLIMTPRPSGGTDLGCVIAFGAPFGR